MSESNRPTVDLAGLERHPLSALWPEMPPEDFAKFVADIAQHGVREPIVLLDGMILDGWHRYRAAKEADQAFESVEYTGDDPVAFVISVNRHRRHLTVEQRVACVIDAREWRSRGNPQGWSQGDETTQMDHRGPIDAHNARARTAKELADESGGSVTVVKRVKRAFREGYGEAIKTGAETTTSLRHKREAEKPPKPRKPSGPKKADVERLKEQNESLRAENERLRSELAKAREFAKSRLMKIQELEAEIAGLRQGGPVVDAPPSTPPPPDPFPPTAPLSRPVDLDGVRGWLEDFGEDEYISDEVRDELHAWLCALTGRDVPPGWSWQSVRRSMYRAIRRGDLRRIF